MQCKCWLHFKIIILKDVFTLQNASLKNGILYRSFIVVPCLKCPIFPQQWSSFWNPFSAGQRDSLNKRLEIHYRKAPQTPLIYWGLKNVNWRHEDKMFSDEAFKPCKMRVFWLFVYRWLTEYMLSCCKCVLLLVVKWYKIHAKDFLKVLSEMEGVFIFHQSAFFNK